MFIFSLFKGTGSLEEIGAQKGKFYSINVPLHENIDDSSYLDIFKHVISNIMTSYRPAAIVLQCGADSLASDRLYFASLLNLRGCFNLSIKGHGACVEYMKRFKVPMLVLGGGGYTIRNVSRCWAYETSLLVEQEIANEIPLTDYRAHYGPDFKLHPDIVDPALDNKNTRSYLDGLKIKISEYLRFLNGAPSVAMNEIPPDIQGFNGDGVGEGDDEEQDLNKDRRDFDGATVERGARGGVDEREYYEDEKDQ